MRNFAKFHTDQSSRCRDISIFRFYRLAAAAILDFLKFHILTVGRVKSVELRHHGKFRVDRSNHSRDITIFRLFQSPVTAKFVKMK